MKFIIERASKGLFDKSRPCPGAKPGPVGHTIEINTLDDLKKLVDREGKIIVSTAFYPQHPGAPKHKITIYDWYVE